MSLFAKVSEKSFKKSTFGHLVINFGSIREVNTELNRDFQIWLRVSLSTALFCRDCKGKMKGGIG